MRATNRKLSRSMYSFIIFCLVGSGLFFTACKKSNDNIPNTPAAGLMAFNLAPDKSAIGVSLSGNSLVSSPIGYTGYTGNYLSIYPGTRSIETFDNNSSPFISSQYSFDTSKYYTLFVVGNNGTYQNLVVNDNVESLTATNGSAYIRYINAIPDSSKPNVSIISGGTNIVNDNAAFTTVSPFVAIPAGDAVIGANNENSIHLNRTINLEEKKVYTVMLVGNPAATDSTAKVQIRFILNGGL